MDKLKEKIDQQELEQKAKYERFYQKNKDSEFQNDLNIMKFRMYTYKEFLKIFANNFNQEYFSGSRYSFYASLFMPTVLMVGFNLFNPFSMFKRIAIFGSGLGSLISFYYNMKDELSDLARHEEGPLGDQIRERFHQLAIYDGLVISFREDAKRIRENKLKQNKL